MYHWEWNYVAFGNLQMLTINSAPSLQFSQIKFGSKAVTPSSLFLSCEYYPPALAGGRSSWRMTVVSIWNRILVSSPTALRKCVQVLLLPTTAKIYYTSSAPTATGLDEENWGDLNQDQIKIEGWLAVITIAFKRLSSFDFELEV